MANNFAGITFGPIVWVKTRTTSYVACPLPRIQINLNIATTTTAHVFP